MPTYNCAPFLQEAINSILRQTFCNFEFLIIDDGSTDDTQKIISSFSDNRINYIKKKHSGLADSLNYGLNRARYDVIARMDADDIAHPNRINKQLKILIQKSDEEIIASWYAVFKDEKIKYIVKTPENYEEIVKNLALYSTIPHSGCMYNRNIIFKYGGYSGNAFEDYSLWLRIKGSIRFYNIPEVLSFVRYRRNSLSRASLTIKHKLIYKIQEPYYQDLGFNFSITNINEVNKIKGWREYFYGSTTLARKYWCRTGTKILFDYRLLLAFVVSFLPNKVFIKFKEVRFRFRINYFIHYFSKENKILRELLNASLQQ